MDNSVREQIIECGITLFGQYGIRSVSIDDVCRKLKISKKTFYVYFNQKEDLVSCVVKQHCEKHLNCLRNSFKGKTALQVLMEFMSNPQKYKPSAANQQRHKIVVYDLQKFYPKLWEEQQRFMEQVEMDGVRRWIKLGIEEGDFREDLDVDLYMVFFKSMTDAFFSLMQRGKVEINGRKIEKRQVYDFYLDLFARQIVSEQGLKKISERLIKE